MIHVEFHASSSSRKWREDGEKMKEQRRGKNNKRRE